MIEVLCGKVDDTDKVSQKCQEYCKYIETHRQWVSISSILLGEFLQDKLNIDGKIFNELIAKHDMSKYHPLEFIPYRGYFYPVDDMEKLQYAEAFKEAWAHHIDHNPHHPEHYLTDKVPYPMPNLYLAEMICDLWAMSIVFKNTPLEYMRKTDEFRYSMHPTSLQKLIDLLKEIDDLQLMNMKRIGLKQHSTAQL